MSEFTTWEVLEMIEAAGLMSRLDLSERDLSGIDLGRSAVLAELHRVHQRDPEAAPLWWGQHNEGLSCTGANLTDADLRGAHLEGASLIAATLRDADLEGAHLEEADIQLSHLEKADLSYAHLEGANMQGAHLQGAWLTSAHLEGAILRRAHLEGAHLDRAHLDKADLIWSYLERADLSGASLRQAKLVELASATGVRLTRATFGETQVTWRELEGNLGEELDRKWREAEEIYLALKSNFEQLGRYEDASWAYRKERCMEKREAWETATMALQERRSGQAIRYGWKAALDQVVELVCDYGESIKRILTTMAVVLLVFAVLYWAIAGVWGPWEKIPEGRIRHITRNPIDLLTFSLGAMTTLGPPGLEARPTLLMRVLMPVQAMLGIVLAGLLGFVLGNRIRRS